MYAIIIIISFEGLAPAQLALCVRGRNIKDRLFSQAVSQLFAS